MIVRQLRFQLYIKASYCVCLKNTIKCIKKNASIARGDTRLMLDLADNKCYIVRFVIVSLIIISTTRARGLIQIRKWCNLCEA